jgi:hypothetical protein
MPQPPPVELMQLTRPELMELRLSMVLLPQNTAPMLF